MLLVTFHGASGGINNVVAYDTSTGAVLNANALAPPTGGLLDELRALAIANGYLYVANGGKSVSSVLCYALPTSQNPGAFAFESTVIASALNGSGDFTTSIAHPFGLAFDGASLFVSNQDTNIVAQVALSSNNQNGTLGAGSQSAALTKLFPPPAVFLDGTFVGSQVGTPPLRGVAISTPNVPQSDGGLGVTVDKSNAPQNSVRDVAAANGILFVCDEVDGVVNLYALADGRFLGASNALAGKPTHFASWGGGLYVSAGSSLYWAQLPASATGASLTLQAVAVTPPAGESIGGISFDPGGGSTQPLAYVPFQSGTGGTGTGSIYAYTVTQSSPSTLPVLSNGTAFVGTATAPLTDTPEFVLFVPDAPAS